MLFMVVLCSIRSTGMEWQCRGGVGGCCHGSGEREEPRRKHSTASTTTMTGMLDPRRASVCFFCLKVLTLLGLGDYSTRTSLARYNCGMTVHWA